MKKEASKWSNARIKYDTVDGYTNKFTNCALNVSMNKDCLKMIDVVFLMHTHFSQECEESLLNGISDLWILRCFTDTETSAIRHVVDSIFGTKNSAEKPGEPF